MSDGNGQMQFGFPTGALGTVADVVERFESPEGGRHYRQIGVRLWGEGAYERDSVDGSRTKYNKLNRVESGDIIVNKIWARNGSVSVVPEHLAGCYCSGEFPLFRPRDQSLHSTWFYWITRTRWFWNQCDHQSRGTSGKNRIRPEKFLTIEIPLPTLVEQLRIVATIDRLVGKIDEAQLLRQPISTEVHSLLLSTFRTAILSAKSFVRIPLEEVCTEIIDCLHSNPVFSDDGVPTLRSPDVGWGNLMLDTARKTSRDEFERRTRRGVPEIGDIVLVREGGGTGKAGIVEEGQEFSLGQRVMQLKPDRAKVLPRFLLYQWLSPLIQHDQITERMKGSASPHLNISALRKFEFILPSLHEQEQIVAKLDRVLRNTESVRHLHRLVAAELDAMLPSVLDRAFKGAL